MESGMDNLFLKNRVLFEWFRDRSCWGVTESEDQRKNRRMPQYFMNRSCLFQDEPIVMILKSVISLRSFNHKSCPPCIVKKSKLVVFKTGVRGVSSRPLRV